MDTVPALTAIESTLGITMESLPFDLAAHLYMNELWLTLLNSRGFILTLVVFSLMLCAAVVGGSKNSAKERELWRRPLTYPLFIPIIGHLLMMGWDSSGFISAVSSVSPHLH